MKLIYFVQYYPPDKSSGLDLVEDLLEGFAKHGWDINLYTPMPTRGVTDDQRKEYKKKRIEKKYDGRLTIHRMHLYREGKSFIPRAIRYLIFSIECLWKAITVPADFIFTGSGPPSQGVIVGIAKFFSKKKKVIYNLQDIFPDSLITSGICNEKSILFRVGKIMERFSYHKADVIITITEDMKRNVIKKGINPRKIKVIRNWIDTKSVVPIDRKRNTLFDELNLPIDKFYVVYAGNIGKVQGVEVIVRAAKQLEEYSNIRFIIFGNGSEEDRIKEEAKGLTNISIYSLMPKERVSEVYSLGDISIVSCKPGTGGSGMPSKTWTIMATGTPIIASFDLGGEMEHIIRKANCGYCVEAGNVKGLTDIILSLSMKKEIVQKMSKNARQFAIEELSKEKAIKDYIDVIENVVC